MTVTRTSVAVTNGAFTVQLDFGASAFPGPSRFLETSVRLTGSGSFTLLSPRQPITSTPYAIRTLSGATADALSSACVSCVQNSQINSVAGSKVSGAIAVASVPGGSGNYIQNATTQQASSNFNISGNGNAGGTLSGNIVNAAKQYNLGGNKVLSVSGNGLVPNSNTFVGVLAGSSNTPAANGDFEGGFNSFLGNFAGASNTTGYVNSFFGYFAGALSTTGRSNSFFGMNSGRSNTIGSENSFFGLQSGNTNSNGGDNSFFGFSAGLFPGQFDRAIRGQVADEIVAFAFGASCAGEIEFARRDENGEERQQHRHAADHGVDEELRRGGSALRSTPEPHEEKRRDQTQFPEDEPVEKVQRCKRPKKPGLKEKHEGKIQGDALDDFPRGQHGHRHDNGREQHHQQAQPIHAEVVLHAQARDPLVLLELRRRVERAPRERARREGERDEDDGGEAARHGAAPKYETSERPSSDVYASA